ncbi:MAG: histidine phosphatase family protein [Clostridia bacterium]|nr:histidine phosphatase family protein [Clostridia bacterium]
MTRLILVRHGQSTGNELHIVTGQGDYPLTALGHAQAKKAATWLLAKEKITKIYSSDLSRAYQTAEPTAECFALPIHTDVGLREMDMGALVGLPHSEWTERFSENWSVWTSAHPHYRAPEGESIPELYERSVKTLSRIAAECDGECVAIFCHMGVMRSFEAFVQNIPCDEIESVSKGRNASIAIYTYEDGKFTPVAYDLVEHLEDSMTGVTFGL